MKKSTDRFSKRSVYSKNGQNIGVKTLELSGDKVIHRAPIYLIERSNEMQRHQVENLLLIFTSYCKQDYMRLIGKTPLFENMEESIKLMGFNTFSRIFKDFQTGRSLEEINRAYIEISKKKQTKISLNFDEFFEAVLIIIGEWRWVVDVFLLNEIEKLQMFLKFNDKTNFDRDNTRPMKV